MANKPVKGKASCAKCGAEIKPCQSATMWSAILRVIQPAARVCRKCGQRQ
jgi:ribosomal protein L40E